VNWLAPLLTQARTTHIIPNEVGFGVNNAHATYQSAITLESLVIS
jgi:hypothetical protein